MLFHRFSDYPSQLFVVCLSAAFALIFPIHRLRMCASRTAAQIPTRLQALVLSSESLLGCIIEGWVVTPAA
jgi:hypothetical protein